MECGFTLKPVRDMIITYSQCNGSLAEKRIKNKIDQLLQKSVTHKYFLSWFQRLDLKSSNKHVSLQNFYIYYTRRKIRTQYKKKKKLKLIAPMWNNESELLTVKYLRLYFVY